MDHSPYGRGIPENDRPVGLGQAESPQGLSNPLVLSNSALHQFHLDRLSHSEKPLVNMQNDLLSKFFNGPAPAPGDFFRISQGL